MGTVTELKQDTTGVHWGGLVSETVKGEQNSGGLGETVTLCAVLRCGFARRTGVICRVIMLIDFVVCICVSTHRKVICRLL
jgi:hypothetical protein